jgi:hypothetical protein
VLILKITPECDLGLNVRTHVRGFADNRNPCRGWGGNGITMHLKHRVPVPGHDPPHEDIVVKVKLVGWNDLDLVREEKLMKVR